MKQVKPLSGMEDIENIDPKNFIRDPSRKDDKREPELFDNYLAVMLIQQSLPATNKQKPSRTRMLKAVSVHGGAIGPSITPALAIPEPPPLPESIFIPRVLRQSLPGTPVPNPLSSDNESQERESAGLFSENQGNEKVSVPNREITTSESIYQTSK